MDCWINQKIVDASWKHSGKSFASCPLVLVSRDSCLIIKGRKITGTSSAAKTEDKLKPYKFIYWWHFRLQNSSRDARKKRFRLHAPAAPRSQMPIWDARVVCDVGTFAKKYLSLGDAKGTFICERLRNGRGWTCSVFHIKSK